MNVRLLGISIHGIWATKSFRTAPSAEISFAALRKGHFVWPMMMTFAQRNSVVELMRTTFGKEDEGS
jgi:hypothetical protein